MTFVHWSIDLVSAHLWDIVFAIAFMLIGFGATAILATFQMKRDPRRNRGR